jgi:hypothetical protein
MAFNPPLQLSWSVVLEGGRWFVDDQWCTDKDRAATSMHKDITAC